MLVHGIVILVAKVSLLVYEKGVHTGSGITDTSLLHLNYCHELLCPPNEIVASHLLVLSNLNHVHFSQSVLKLFHERLVLFLLIFHRLECLFLGFKSCRLLHLLGDLCALGRLLDCERLNLHE